MLCILGLLASYLSHILKQMTCLFSQAFVEDWAGVFLHGIPSGNRLLILNETGLGSVNGCKNIIQVHEIYETFHRSWHSAHVKFSYLMTFSHLISQNQLLTKGMVILRDKIRFYEGTTKRGLNTLCGGQHQYIKLNRTVLFGLPLCGHCRSEVTWLSGRNLGLLLLWCSLDVAGHLPPSSGTS